MISSDSAAVGSGVFLVGQRYRHHARHSGYELFHRYIGTHLKAPTSVRYFPYGWMNGIFARLLGRCYYSPGAFLTELWAAPRLLRRQGLYHLLYGDTDYWLLGHLPRPAGTRLVATFHEPLETLEQMGLKDRLIQSLDAVILVSGSQRPFFERRLAAQRVFVVPLGVDTEFFRPAEGPPAERICITVGEHHRDFQTLAEAFELISEEAPGTRLVAVGTHRSHQPAPFVAPAAEFLCGIGDEQLRRSYQRSRVAVFCYRQATASIGLLEAMACGTPVVATAVGGIPEYLGDAGVLCPPSAPQAIADAVIRVFSDNEVARQLRVAGRARALEFDFQAVAQRQAEVYNRISLCL